MSAPPTGSALGVLLPGFEGTTLPHWLRDLLGAGLAGVCLFGSNITGARQLAALTETVYAENPHAIVAVDEEGGDVTRLFATTGSPFPGNAVLGRLDDPTATYEAARQIGWALRRVGCNVDFAPSVDINSRSDNPVIGVRSFSASTETVARHAAAWVAGLQSTGVAASAKHFPGHGDTGQDSHVSQPVIQRSVEQLRGRELVPFAAAIRAGTRLVMTSHILLPQVDADDPATMSRAVLGGLLRSELGFDGVVVSDALDMAGASAGRGMTGAAVRALHGGCDLLCLGQNSTPEQVGDVEQGLVRAVAEGILEADLMSRAAGRVRALAQDLRDNAPALPTEPRPADGGIPAGAEVRMIDAFDIQPAAAGRCRPLPEGSCVVRLEIGSNIAVGATPWGPFAAVLAEPESAVSLAFSRHRVFDVTAENGVALDLSPDQTVLVIGRNIHRHPFARAAVDRLRADHADVLVVDMGWPSDDRRYADVATFGASRLLGRALLAYLAGADPSRPPGSAG